MPKGGTTRLVMQYNIVEKRIIPLLFNYEENSPDIGRVRSHLYYRGGWFVKRRFATEGG